MKIMLINHYAGSPKMGMEYRPYYLAKEWIKMGHEVVILAADQAHVRTIQPVISKSFTVQNIDGIEYLWVKTPAYEGNGFSRVKNMYSFVSQIRRKSSWLASKYNPDLVIASSTYPLDNYVAQKIAKKSGAKYYYEVHDLWPLSPKELGGMSAIHPFIIWMQIAENYAYKHCDRVISMLPKTQAHMKAHGLDLNKWRYVPNGIYLPDWEKSEELNKSIEEKINEIKGQFKFLIGYTGSFGIANALSSLIETANLLKESEIGFVLVGDGPELSNLQQLKEILKCENVFFIPSISKLEIPNLLQKFDVLYIGLQQQPLFRFGISPNKIIDYMMASKPIIQAIAAGNNMVKEAECGVDVEPENPKAIAEAILKMWKMDKGAREKMGEKGKAFVLKYHDYKGLAKRFLEDF